MALEWFGHQEAGLSGLLLLVERDLSIKQRVKEHYKVCIQAKTRSLNEMNFSSGYGGGGGGGDGAHIQQYSWEFQRGERWGGGIFVTKKW